MLKSEACVFLLTKFTKLGISTRSPVLMGAFDTLRKYSFPCFASSTYSTANGIWYGNPSTGYSSCEFFV